MNKKKQLIENNRTEMNRTHKGSEQQNRIEHVYH